MPMATARATSKTSTFSRHAALGRLEPFVSGLFQALHLLFQGRLVRLLRHRLLAARDGRLDRLDGLRREDVALVVKELLDMLAHGRGLANRLGQEPAEENGKRRTRSVG